MHRPADALTPLQQSARQYLSTRLFYDYCLFSEILYELFYRRRGSFIGAISGRPGIATVLFPKTWIIKLAITVVLRHL